METLPTIKQIEQGEFTTPAKQNLLNVLLNQEPPENWIKKHPIAKKVKYLPIDKVEFLLTKIFINWFVEIKNIQTIANSVCVTVRLNYQNQIDGKYHYQEGCGAAPIHTAKDAGAMDWNAVLADSVMKAAPAAESYAIKDAAEKIGRIFGKDLNRVDYLLYDDLINMNDDRFKDAKITEK